MKCKLKVQSKIIRVMNLEIKKKIINKKFSYTYRYTLKASLNGKNDLELNMNKNIRF